MVAHRHVEFIGVKLATPVEKATTGPVVKAAAVPCAGEARGERETRWRERKTGCCALARRRCQWSGGTTERGAVESVVAEAAQRSVGIAVR
jgi:hypothetical protein